MNLQELQTLVSMNANVILFVINNNGYDSIRQSQKKVLGESIETLHGVSPDNGLSFPSLEKLSAAYGIKYSKVCQNSSLKANVLDCIRQSGPLLCEIIVDDSQDFAPKVSAHVRDDGSIVSGSLINMSPIMDIDQVNLIIEGLVS